MKLHSTCSRGFTLIEVVVSICIFSFVVASQSFVGIGMLGKHKLQSEVGEIVELLESAQAKALMGVGGDSQVIDVQGEKIVFEFLTGETEHREIVISNGTKTKTIVVESSGIKSY